jgi:hypothetical protein
VLVGGEEEHADAEGLSLFEGDAGLFEEEGLGDGGHEAYAVAALAVGGDSATVGEALEGGEGLLEDGVRGGGVDRGDEAYAAGVMVEALVEQGGDWALGGAGAEARGGRTNGVLRMYGEAIHR